MTGPIPNAGSLLRRSRFPACRRCRCRRCCRLGDVGLGKLVQHHLRAHTLHDAPLHLHVRGAEDVLGLVEASLLGRPGLAQEHLDHLLVLLLFPLSHLRLAAAAGRREGRGALLHVLRPDAVRELPQACAHAALQSPDVLVEHVDIRRGYGGLVRIREHLLQQLGLVVLVELPAVPRRVPGPQVSQRGLQVDGRGLPGGLWGRRSRVDGTLRRRQFQFLVLGLRRCGRLRLGGVRGEGDGLCFLGCMVRGVVLPTVLPRPFGGMV